PMAPDLVLLRVPFDFENWNANGVGEGAKQNGTGSGAANSDSYAEGEGSRCSNVRQGVDAFVKAIKAAALPADETSILITVRTTLVADCNTTTSMNSWKPPDGIRSAVGRQFALYAAGANA